MSNVSLKNIYKTYPNGFEAVKDFNLEIQDKEFIVLTGPSGCGKSTALRMMTGLEDISSGEFKIDDEVMNDLPPKDRDIAMLFKNYAVYPQMSVYDNMAFGLQLRMLPKDEVDRKVREAAKLLELDHLLDRKPKALSEGQRLRVGLGRAIVLNPKVFLMEEPFSKLDTKVKEQMGYEVSKLNEKLGTTIVYVTNDPTEALLLGSRIVVMNQGVIQQIGNPLELYDEPCNLFVAGYFGMPGMNFLDAKCSADGDSVMLDLGKSSIKLQGEKAERLIEEGYDGKTVVIGIRPEDIHDEMAFINRSKETVIEGNIYAHEVQGYEFLIYFEYGEYSLISRTTPRTKVRTGDVVRFAIDEDKIHIFDKETEEAIIH